MTAAVAALVIAAGVAAYVMTHSGSSSPGRASKASRSSAEVYGTFGAFGVAYGVRSRQLLARFGPPDQRRGGCWIYRISGQTFHGTKLGPQLAGVDAVRYCFYSGVLAIIEDHWRKTNGKYPYREPWAAPITYGCGGHACVRPQL